MKKKIVLGCLMFALIFTLSTMVAFAKLAAVGPNNPNNGFPAYYQDTNGVALELTAPPFGTPETATGPDPTPPTMVFDAPDAANAFSTQIGFGTEAFYWYCTAAGDPALTGKFQDANGNKIVFVLGLEATFAPDPQNNPDVRDGKQYVFSRLRLTYRDAPKAGTYTLRHPYGVETITITANAVAKRRGIRFTRDIPPVAGNFGLALTGDVGPFLQQLNPPPVVPAGTPAPFDTGWIGDGVTVATITGSPINYNKVRLEGPTGSNIGGPGVDFVETPLFIVSGHIYSGTTPPPAIPLAITRATVNNGNGAPTVDVAATAAATATLTATLQGGTPVPLAPAQGAGNFFARIPVPTGTGAPSTITVDAVVPAPAGAAAGLAAAAGAASATIKVVDLVTIKLAEYNLTTQRLTVQADSTAIQFKPTLTVVGIGQMNNGSLTKKTLKVVTSVTVSSSRGGSATVPVIFKK